MLSQGLCHVSQISYSSFSFPTCHLSLPSCPALTCPYFQRRGGAQRLCMLSDLYLGCFRSISGCVLAKVMFFLLFKCYTMERKGESHTERDREERLGRESLIICVTSGADTGISMATRRNKNDREGG